MTEPHRKTIVHYNVPGHAHQLTFCCYKKAPLLNKGDTWRSWFSESVDRALEGHAFQLIAFVYMPEHIHLLVYPTKEEYSISDLLFAIKRPFSYHVKKSLEEMESPLLKKLTIRDRPGHTSFRFWQEGPGHDRNVVAMEHAIKSAEYIHNNPVRRRLCESPDQWRWSSWKFYHRPDEYKADKALPYVHGFPG